MASYRSYGPQPYRTDSVWDGVDRGYKFGNSLRDDVTRSRAGAALAGGDLQGSANALLMNGDFDNGLKVRQAGIDADAKRLAGEKARKDEGLKYIEQAASRLADIHRSGKDPAKTAAAFDQYFAQGFRDAGEDEADIAQLRTGLLTDPDTTLMALGAGAAKELGYDVRNAGDEVIIIDKATGREVRRYRGAKTVTLGEGVDLVDVPGTYDSAPEGDVPSPPEPPAASLEPDASPAENIRGIVDRLVSAGARITSARRSPEENARVRGAKNSYHLRGQAFDIVPPPGMSMSELADQLRRTGVDFAELIDEGDHVHIAWNDAKRPGAAPVASDVPAGGARVIARGREKPQPAKVRPATAAEKAAYGIAPDVPAQIKPDGSIDVVGGLGTASDRKAETDLRKEFNSRPEVKEYRDVATSYNTIKDLFSKAPTAAGDIAGIFSFMKMLDPGSVVREGEFANAQNAAGVPDRIANLYNNLLKGQRLNPKQRADFIAQAESIYATRSRRYGELVREYRGYAEGYGVNPDRIGTLPQAPASPPPGKRLSPAEAAKLAPGTRFIGEDGVERVRR